jgi:adenosylmethionine-8-amino-7-oxononanoate aminotransferase
MLTQPAGYLEAIRELTRKYGVLLLVDEVATGFGRTGRMFACEHEQISPDMMMLSKGITGGYLPLAVTAVTDEIYGAFLGEYHEQKTFYHGHSYTGNPLACAAALANLEIFRKERVLEKLPEKISLVKKEMAKIGQLKQVGDIRQRGMIVGIELVADPSKRRAYPAHMAVGAMVCKLAREYGLMIRPLGNVIVFMPPLASTVQELTEMLDILWRAIREVTENFQEFAAEKTEAVMI